MVETILSHPLVREALLPFLLIFAVSFAVLQKSKILGDGKKQIDAMVAFAIGLIAISFGYATNIISHIVPFLAVCLVVILTFMLLWGMTHKGGKDGFDMPKGVKIAAGVLIAIALAVAVIYFTGAWDYLSQFVKGDNASMWISTIVLVVIIGGGIAVVLSTKDSSGKDKDKDKE